MGEEQGSWLPCGGRGGEKNEGRDAVKRYTLVLLLSYTGVVGGTVWLVGTSTNLEGFQWPMGMRVNLD